MAKDARRDLRSYRSAAAQLKRTGPHVCHVCRKPINPTLDYRDPLAFTADHVTALSAGGHIHGPLLPAHRMCNAHRGNGAKEAAFPTTRAW